MAYTYSRFDVFRDALQLMIHSHHPKTLVGLKDEENEKKYMACIHKYTKETINRFPKLLAYLYQNVLENPYSDILGDYFQEFITNGEKGQFFTPEHVCDVMAQITLTKEATEKTVADIACGSGRLLLSGAKLAPNNYFYGADVDEVCCMMSVINFFLNGLSGEVVQMNSLSNEFYRGWYILPKGTFGILPITEKENSFVWRVGENFRQDHETKKAAQQAQPEQQKKTATPPPPFDNHPKPKKLVVQPLSLF